MSVPAHEWLRSQDCLEYGCENDAGPDGVCDEHVMWRNRRGAELARRAVDLRASGLSIADVGAALGVGRAYASVLATDPTRAKEKARKNAYRKPCPSCGALMDGSGGPNVSPSLCATCSQQKQHDDRRWTRETIIEAIHAFVSLVGRPPLSQEWLYSGTRATLPPPPEPFADWPWAGEVLREFGKWADAIEAAGFERPYVGHKVRPMSPVGQRRDGLPLQHDYIVFAKDDEGRLCELGRALAREPSLALEAVVAAGNGHGDEFWVVSVRQLGAPFKIQMKPVFARVPVEQPA